MKLFEPLQLRGLKLRNRCVVSPMCQYSADDGHATDYHLVHLGRFAMGGFGLVFTEATAVTAQGRISPGDTGLWADSQIDKWRDVTRFIQSQGAAAGIQLAHAGRKASSQRPWDGGKPLTTEDAKQGEVPWQTVAPSAAAFDAGWPQPASLSLQDISQLRADFDAAVHRAVAAGFDVLELHAAHGYLLNSFLSPLANHRTDEYGGDRAGRMRLLLEIATAARAVWPQDKPVFVRVSAVDGADGGVTLEDTVAFARELKRIGVDVMDCSSGGVVPVHGGKPGYGYQIPYAAQIREQADIATMTVGLIVSASQAENIIASGQADLVALGREALFDPQWPLHAEAAASSPELPGASEDFANWPQQSAWWLERRARQLRKLGPHRDNA
ncbi:MAG: NADH:flavin oxidoreductase/NADH oxidase [Sinobacteraceae bacterium]|nr:NADH:flavin oxidoreductase/NADH oxidase [Nevskiaceae bacterium]